MKTMLHDIFLPCLKILAIGSHKLCNKAVLVLQHTQKILPQATDNKIRRKEIMYLKVTEIIESLSAFLIFAILVLHPCHQIVQIT
jgi:hypothetical protein